MDLHTGTPFWVLRDGLPYTYPPLVGDASADVLVVGAGITGAAVAYELSRAGLHVIVVDRRDAASGSSAASTGLLLYETDSSLADLGELRGHDAAGRIYQLGIEAIDSIEQFCSGRARAAEFRRRPSLYLASRRTHVEQLRLEHSLRQAHGFPAEWLDREAIKARYGFAAPAAIRTTGTAQVDCYRLTHELLAAARARGASVYDRTAVSFPERIRGRMFARTDRGGTITANEVVWATGYEGAPIAPEGVHLSSTWVIVTEPIEGADRWEEPCLIWETARPYIYVRSTDDGRIMVGGEDEDCAECHRSARWFHTKTRRLLARASGLFPSARLEIAYAWAGTFSRTDDGLPMIGEMDRHPGVWLTLGYGGNGITFGVIAARLLCERFMTGRSDDLRLFPPHGNVAAGHTDDVPNQRVERV